MKGTIQKTNKQRLEEMKEIEKWLLENRVKAYAQALCNEFTMVGNYQETAKKMYAALDEIKGMTAIRESLERDIKIEEEYSRSSR